MDSGPDLIPPQSLRLAQLTQDDREVLENLTRRFLREIARLGGEPDYEPELAGRFYKPGRT